MADLSIQYTEEMVGANHPSKADTLNRMALVEHNNTGVHKDLFAINVKHKGALGDGVTDDIIAINAAVTAAIAASNVAVVYFPPGVYMISAAIAVTAGNLVFRGEGVVSTIKTIPNAVDFAGNFVISTGLSNITIENLAIDGNSANNTGNTTSGIYGTNTTNLSLRNLIIKNTPKNGIFLSATNLAHTNVVIDGNALSNIGWGGIAVDKCREGIISNNRIISSGSHGISASYGTTAGADSSYRVNIVNNVINRATPPTTILTGQVESGFMILLGEGSQGCTVSNNVCWDNRNAGNDGIATVGTAGDTGTIYQGITISNNVVAFAGGFGIDATSLCTVTGNIVLFSGTHGIILGGDLEPIRHDVIIANNIISNSDAANVGGIAGILVIAVNNGFIGPFTWNRIKICNNIIADSRTNKRMAFGIAIDATVPLIDGLDISHNDCIDVVTESIHIVTPANISNFRRHENTEKTPWATLADTATPSVLGQNLFNSTGATTITNFTNGRVGQEIWITFGAARTIKFSGNPNMFGNGQVDWVAGVGDQMKCIADLNGFWRCIVG